MFILQSETAKQNQKFPFHFLSAPPTPPAEENKKGKEIFGFCSRDRRERTRRASLVIRVQFKIHSNFVQYTPPVLIPTARFFRAAYALPSE